ncbi:MAG: phosphocholine cytidylyltransferase family protein [Coxiellaceae bacterium]|nr:phosphocholine cytidylyltransferase family protein [Coxiellaceae bacterium]
MKAIILAAGRGNRMGDLTNNNSKGLIGLHGRPLIEWQMEAIKKAGIDQIAIIKGYCGDVFTYSLTYFENKRWHQTNMLSTLLCANDWLNQTTCIVSYSDIVYQPEAIQKLKEASGDIVITFDKNWLNLWRQRFDDPLSDAEIFKYKNDSLIDIGGKTENLSDIQGQYMGLLKFTVKGWRKITLFLDQFADNVIDKMDMTALLKLLLKNNFKISVVAIDSPWCEIDNVKDYELCQKIMSMEIKSP